MAQRRPSKVQERIERLRGRPLADDLRQLYVVEDRTQPQIAELYGVDVSTVNRWLDRHGIPSRRWAHVADNDRAAVSPN